MLALSLTITGGWWILPTLITIICMLLMFRPIYDYFGIGTLFQFIYCLFPILIAWLIYFIIF